MCCSRKHSYSSHCWDWNFLGVWWGKISVSQKQLNRRTCRKLNWNFKRDGWSWKNIPLLGRYGDFLGVHNQGSINRTWSPEVPQPFTYIVMLKTFSCRIPNINDLEVVCRRNDLLTHLMDHPGDWTPVVTDWLLHLVTRGLGKRIEILCFKPQTPLQVN